MKRFTHRSVVTLVVSLLVAGAPLAHAGPLEDLLRPPRDPALIMPTPLGDPWYSPPVDFGKRPPGTLLAARPSTGGPLLTPVVATELLVRSSSAKGQPAAVVATVLVPRAPWLGTGPRPVVAYNLAIDSLGATCAPSHQLRVGVSAEMALVQYFLARNYAVVIPDHQGPRQAYAAGPMAGHAVLDAIRGALGAPMLGLSPGAPVAITGYSGGAIATGWAVQMAAGYAPGLKIAGAALGGVPADYRILLASMNGANLASGIFLAATLGVMREYQELLPLLNDNGWRLAMLMKDMCLFGAAIPGAVAPIPAGALSDVPDVVNTPVAQRVIAENRMGGRTPQAPVFIYQGRDEIWIPRANADHLYDDWCRRGATVRLEQYPGEHLAVALSGPPAAYTWIDDRLAGKSLPKGCSNFGR